MIKLLLVEDDKDFAFIVKGIMEIKYKDYEIFLAENGEDGLQVFSEVAPDIIVADIILPSMDGIEMVKHIRLLDKHVPIIFASGKDSSKDVTDGVDAGANYYIKKPYLPEELDAHIRALLRSIQNQSEKNNGKRYQIGKYIFDPSCYLLTYHSQKYRLTPTESLIFTLLCENLGELVRREDILMKCWGKTDSYASNSLDVFISKLRKQLSNDSSVSINNSKRLGLTLEVK